MFNSNLFSDTFDFIDPSLLQSELQFCMPPIDSFSDVPVDIFPFQDYEVPESAQMLQMFDQALQNYTKEFMKMYPNAVEPGFAFEGQAEKPRFSYKNCVKVGTITAEERRMKVLRFLEKRKRRVYTKKISYLCRKRVADQRQRYKGRFVSKKIEATQASIETKSET
jgi:hypothetical protein